MKADAPAMWCFYGSWWKAWTWFNWRRVDDWMIHLARDEVVIGRAEYRQLIGLEGPCVFDLKPDSILVIQSRESLSESTYHRLKESLTGAFPKHKWVVFENQTVCLVNPV